MGQIPIIPVKVFGLQRTGTNLMQLLLLQNFHVHCNQTEGGWKHGPITEADRQWNGQLVRFTLCVKNPYSWLFSCYRYYGENFQIDDSVPPQFLARPDMSFEQFVQGPCFDFESPIHNWNIMNRHWLDQLPVDRRFIVRQEDQLHHQADVLAKAGAALGLTAKQTPFILVNRRVSVRMRTDDPIDYAFYESHGYLKQFTPALLQQVNGLLDWELMSQFDYARQKVT